MKLKNHKFAVLEITEANIGSEITKKELHIRGHDITPDTGRNTKNRMSRTYTVRKDLAKYEIPEIWGEANEKEH